MYNINSRHTNRFAPNKLSIDCSAIAENYANIKEFIGNKVECTATIKANAYGLGAIPIMHRLSKSGCNKFFVTSIDEALELRNISVTDEIYVLNGVYPGEEAEFAQHQIIPVLNTKGQFELFNSYCCRKNKSFEAVLNINTGLNYIGFCVNEAIELANAGFFNAKVKIRFIMSRLACSTQANNPYNLKQLDLVKKLQQTFKLPVSIADSGAICLGSEYHLDLARPGIMLYGVKVAPTDIKLRPAVSLVSSIIQIKEAKEDLFVGYDNAGKISKGSILATIPIGYADGIMRSISNKAVFYINGEPVKIIGNVSMDLIALDVTKINKHFLHLGAEVEVLGENSTVEALAKAADTSCHEIITNLGRRLKRLYF